MMATIFKKLNVWYYLSFVELAFVALLGYYLTRQGIFISQPGESLSILLNSILILYAIITIPLALKLFSVYVNRLQGLEDHEARVTKYIRYAKLRISVITLALLLSVLGFYLLADRGLLFLSGICFIALFFAKPTELKIAQDLHLIEKEQEPAEEQQIEDTDKDLEV